MNWYLKIVQLKLVETHYTSIVKLWSSKSCTKFQGENKSMIAATKPPLTVDERNQAHHRLDV